MTLGGIIYLLSIADNRMKSTTRRNIGMFHKLCGDKDLARVVLGTTNWGEVDEEVGKNREEQLVKTFWNPASESTRKSLRFDNTEKSARAFLDAILGQMKFGGNEEILDDNVLRTQNELDIKIPETVTSQVVMRTTPKRRGAASRKKWGRMIPTDNIMVGGRPTDIVIPCDSIHRFYYYLITYQFSVLWAQLGLEKAPYAPRDSESSLFSLTSHSSSTPFSGKMSWASAMIFRVAPPQYNA